MLQRSLLVVAGLALGLTLAMGTVAALPGPEVGTQKQVGVAAADQTAAVRRAAIWLVRVHQNSDGGYSSFSAGANQAPSTVGGTVDAILALAAAGYSAGVPFPGRSETPLGYLAANPQDVLDFAQADGAQAGKLILALTATSADPRAFAGQDLVATLTGQLDAEGSYAVADVFKQATAVLGLVAAGEPIPAAALQWIVDRQAANGSWDDGFGTLDNADATAMAIMALLAAGRPVDDPAITAARDFLADAQLPGAGWQYGPGFGGNANSTGLVIQALSALGEEWSSESGPWTKGGQSPLGALLTFQSSSGAFQVDFGQGPFDDFFTTVQALPAATGRPLPLPGRHEAAQRGLSCLASLQDEATGGWEQFAGFGVSTAGTSRAIEAIRAAGGDPQDGRWTTSGGASAVDHLEVSAPGYLSGGRGGRVGTVIQGVVAAGSPYRVDAFAGLDLPLLVSGYLSRTGEYDDTAFGIFAHAEAMLGLLVADEPVDPSAVAFLLGEQDGGDWGTAEENGIALNVLGRLEHGLPPGALNQLHDAQLPNGGWGFDENLNVSATSEVVQGLVQVNENPFGPAWSVVVDGRLTTAAEAIMSGQGSNGCWPNAFGPGDDPFSTTDAIMALSLEPSWDVALVHLPVVSGSGR
jgi:hypothetical protein